LRFERLAIPAFGPFTDLALELPAAGGDFHLVYGPNEAGKSSLLRAIRDLLFGIPGQTPDDFLHDYKRLRIAATLALRDGQRLAVQRRKGNRNTLLDATGDALPDDALAPFLGAVDREYFTTMFGLDAAALREGAAALLQGQGDLGQALFSASLAGTPVHRILDALDAEARRLFDGRARTNVTIRPAVDDYETHLRASRDATVKSEAWDAAVLALESATAERDRLDAELADRRARADWVARCLDALPAVGRLQEATERLAALPPCPPVPPGFVAEGEAALERVAALETARAGARARVARLEAQLAALAARQDVLDRAGEIEAAHQALPLYRKQREELAGVESERGAAQTALRAALQRLGLPGDPAQAESLRSTLAEELVARAAADDLTAAEGALQRIEDENRRLEQALEGENARLARLGSVDVAALRGALAETEGAATAAQTLAALETARASAEQAMARALAPLRAAPGDPAATYALPVPLLATLRQFEGRLGAIDRQRDAATQQRDGVTSTLRDIATKLRRLEQRGDIPTPEALAVARARRDAAWDAVLAAWQARVDGQPVEGVPLEQAYPRTVQAADAIADGLRDDASRVAEAGELALRRVEAEAQADEAAAILAAADADLNGWRLDWREAWRPCGIVPDTVAEMLEWRDLWMDFRARFEQWRDARDRLAAARAAIDTAVARLRPLLDEAPPQASLPALRAEAERRVRAADEAQGQRRAVIERRAEIEKTLAQLQAERPAAADSAAVARQAWQAHCAVIGAPADAPPVAGLAVLDARREAVERHDALGVLESRAASLAAAIDRYESGVANLADALVLTPGSVEAREGLAWDLVQDTRADAARRAQLARQLDDERGMLADAEAQALQAEAEIARLLALAGVARREELQALLHRLIERADAETAVLTQRDALQGAARGGPLDAFIARVQAESRDGLAAEHAALVEQIEALVRRRDEQVKEVSRCEQARQHLERAGSEAAEHLQAARHAAVRIRHDAARYLRLRLATAFLREQIEQFRRENQGPLLRRAGEIFAVVTRGSFEGLGTAFSDDDTPVLVGIRNGAEVGVDGMSEGTCDQLYLALRLAAIEQHAAGHEPMPVILDDLLVTFDDDRASATLPILRDLGTRTQVFLFTHHHHLVQLAKSALPDDGVHYHELSGAR
jgi:uncharacterized protein YhaN